MGLNTPFSAQSPFGFVPTVAPSISVQCGKIALQSGKFQPPHGTVAEKRPELLLGHRGYITGGDVLQLG